MSLAEPLPNHTNDILDLVGGQFSTLGDSVPLGQAFAAACGCGVLGHEYRVVPHGGLFAVVGRAGWGEPDLDELPGVLEDNRQALLLQIGPLLAG